MRFETVFEKRVTRSIEDWLGQLGLARYAEAFVAAEIDVDVVAELTDADLVSLGVLLGDRKRILRASAEKPAAAPPRQSRQPSVIYCDLVESTDLAVRLDPRELRAVMADYHARCADVVAAHGGEAQYLGGGVMVRFAGGPGDAEDAARATHCALALIVAIGEFAFPGPTHLKTRIGIATGSEADPSIPSLAARLQRFADPERVLVADVTRRLLRDTFSFTPQGSRAVAGLADRIEVWQVDSQMRHGDEASLGEPASSQPLSNARATSPPALSPSATNPSTKADAFAATPTITVAVAAADVTMPKPPAEPQFVERHFEDDGKPLAALKHWQRELERAEGQRDFNLRLDALHALWTVAFSIGDLSYTLDATARGVTLYDSARHDTRTELGDGHDAGVCAAGYRALALILCGRIAEGRSWLRRTEAAITRFEHPPTRCSGTLEVAIARDLLGEYDVAIALANEARKLASKYGFPTSHAHAALASAGARIGMGDRIAGMRALANKLDEPGSALPTGWQPYYLVRLAFAEIAMGNVKVAAERLDAAENIARVRGGCIAQAEIQRAAAALLHLRGAPAAAVTERLEGAAQFARTQLAALLELRAASDALDFSLPLPDESAGAALGRIRRLLARIEGSETTSDVRRARTLEQRAVARS